MGRISCERCRQISEFRILNSELFGHFGFAGRERSGLVKNHGGDFTGFFPTPRRRESKFRVARRHWRWP